MDKSSGWLKSQILDRVAFLSLFLKSDRYNAVSVVINDSSRQDLLNLFGTEPDAQDIPRRRVENFGLATKG
jgi:hypothetical protein